MSRIAQFRFRTMSLALLVAAAGSSYAAEPSDTASAASYDAATAVAPAAVPPFKHPGLLMTQNRLASIRAAVQSGNSSAMKTGYNRVLQDNRGSHTYAHQALATVEVVRAAGGPQEGRWKNDGFAAYLNALRWAVSGDTRNRDKAILIIDAWSAKFTGFTLAPGTDAPQAWLEAAWGLPVWASAAEILRHHDGGAAGWPQASQDRFNGYLNRLYGYANQASARTNNWGVSGALATMATGVYQDDANRYNAGLNRMKQLIPLIVYSSGEVQELAARDCHHPQYSLAGIAQAAEMATIQGDTSVWLFKVGNEAQPRFARGLEYMAKSILYGEGVRDCRSNGLYPGYSEIAVNGYMNRGTPIANFQNATKRGRPDGNAAEFIGWSAATHGRDDF
ncbi:alginate lyase family protein [Lysobacter enzymogenes]|uniref:alginate lyase family protein n=1 Tax=Lysobacter enzymogenes TaxID=69 RepID=UPI0008994F60|nr:alginate lyase family protein [Lysobacter enzymogenes]SDX72366.1 Alginate lyase [Lysobacter enzymogenes]